MHACVNVDVSITIYLFCEYCCSYSSMGISRSNGVLRRMSSHTAALDPQPFRALLVLARAATGGATLPASQRRLPGLASRERAFLHNLHRITRLPSHHIRSTKPDYPNKSMSHQRYGLRPRLIHWPLGRLH